jgi:error-prone DNA polymerase
MGFYSPATLVLDARHRGVRIRPVHVAESDWLCTVGPDDTLRLGLCYVRGLAPHDGQRIVAERQRAPFASLADFQLRTGLAKPALRPLAQLGALNGLAGHRRDAQWQVEVRRAPDDLFAQASAPAFLPLAPMSPAERTQADYHATGLTTGPHPMAAIRAKFPGAADLWRAAELTQARTGTLLRIAGLVICRQRPGTAKGFVFVSLEDETGVANAIITPQLFEQCRLLLSEEPFLIIEGVVQNIDRVIHVKARSVAPLPAAELSAPASHDFH